MNPNKTNNKIWSNIASLFGMPGPNKKDERKNIFSEKVCYF